jgi:hypothetical protein
VRFCRAKGVGDCGETIVEGLLARAGLPCERPSTSFAGWDLLSSLNGRAFTIEAKYDLKQAHTGNAAIEFFNPKRGEKSGLAATQADLWAHVVRPGKVFLGLVSRLREFTEREKPIRTMIAAGDGNASIWLYPWASLLTVLEPTEGLSREELLSLLESLLD